MSALPIPQFKGVKETVYHEDSAVIIAPDHNAGHKHRYSVVRIYWTGESRCIGRELPLALSRNVARRSASEDGKAL